MRSKPLQSQREKVLIFMHIPKTAGISFRRMMKVKVASWPPSRLLHHNQTLGYYKTQSFDERLNVLSRLSDVERSRIRYLEGHYGYGLHEYVRRPSVYLTLLRDPIDRTISTYYHLTSPAVSRRYSVPKVSFAEMIAMGKTFAPAHHLDNCQVRYLAGEGGKRIEAPFGECTQEMLTRAIQRLEGFAFVGLTGRFDESVVLLRESMGWWFTYYKRRNVSRTRPPYPRLSDTELELAQRHNQLDLQLYRHGVALFERRIAEQGPGFNRKVARFQQLNRLVHRLPLP